MCEPQPSPPGDAQHTPCGAPPPHEGGGCLCRMAAKNSVTPARHRFADVCSLVHESCVTHRSTVKIGYKLCAWGYTLLYTLVIVQHLLRSSTQIRHAFKWWTPKLQQEQLGCLHRSFQYHIGLTPQHLTAWANGPHTQPDRVHTSRPVGQSRTTLSQLQPEQAPGATVAAQLATQLLMPAALVPLQDRLHASVALMPPFLPMDNRAQALQGHRTADANTQAGTSL